VGLADLVGEVAGVVGPPGVGEPVVGTGLGEGLGEHAAMTNARARRAATGRPIAVRRPSSLIDRPYTRSPMTALTLSCPHTPERVASPSGGACEECGSTWNLRLCASCGHVGCCESQAGHARAHALGVDHPVIYQMPVGPGSFVWCYAEDRYL